jgi:hypothetical protein
MKAFVRSNKRVYPASESSIPTQRLFCGLCNRFFSTTFKPKQEREKLIEFVIISEFNTELVLNDEEVTLKPNKLINFILSEAFS